MSHRRQRVRVGQLFSSWKTLSGGMPQGHTAPVLMIPDKQFVSVFTREEILDTPKLHGPNYPDIRVYIFPEQQLRMQFGHHL